MLSTLHVQQHFTPRQLQAVDVIIMFPTLYEETGLRGPWNLLKITQRIRA